MATEKDEIMARSGPEDNLVAVATNVNSSEFRTAGNDWVVSRASHFAPEALHYKDATEQARLTAQLLSKGATGDIMRDLVMQRNLCAKQVYMNKLCLEGFKAHQQKQCTPTMLEYVKCGTKLARAVDILCRKPFWDYQQCVDKSGKGAKECVSKWTAFDQCTEDF